LKDRRVKMKQRLLTAAVGLSVLCLIFFFFGTWFFNFAIGLISALAVFEVLKTTECHKHRLLTGVSLVFALLVPFFRTPGFNLFGRIAVAGYLLVLFGVLLLQHETIRFEKAAVTFMASLLIPFSMSTMIYMRDQFPRDGLFFSLLVFAGAWAADTGGYFIGRFFGKHKLAPKISPKKTVEGAIGGVVFNIAFFLLMGLGYFFCQQQMGASVEIHYIQMGIAGVILALIGMLGDLAASLVKRQCGVKDYGSIFPGHGGIMDRFDSVLFVAPCLYVLLQFMTLVS